MQRGLACCATAGAAAMLSRGGRAGKKSAPAAGTGGAADALTVRAQVLRRGAAVRKALRRGISPRNG